MSQEEGNLMIYTNLGLLHPDISMLLANGMFTYH